MRSLENILENPPQKEVKCSRCGGSGMINLRGMISSDDCPKCNSSGKVFVTDFKEWIKLVKKRFRHDTKKMLS